jgi:hypothetical protein
MNFPAMRGKLFLISAFVFSFGAQAQQLEFWNNIHTQGEITAPDSELKQVTIGAYNLENLFDTEHDEGKDDYARLPKAWKNAHPDIMRRSCEAMSNPYYKKECYDLDWSESVLNHKIENMGRAIRSLNGGKGPDILVVEEVENIKVLTRLRDQALQGMGYDHVLLIEGPDSRGIDVGMLSKLPVEDAQLHIVDLNSPVPNPMVISMEESMNPLWTEAGQFMIQQTQSGHATRGILEATFRVGNKYLTVLGNHWPSQAGPTEQRARAAWTLYQAASKAYDRKRTVVALGDFNTIDSDNPNPFEQYLKNPRNPLQFVDARDEFIRRYGADHLSPGTHNYKGEWSFLDRYFVLKQSMSRGMESEWANFGVNAADFLLQERNGTRAPQPKSLDFDLFGNFIGDLGSALGGSLPGNKIPMRFDPETGTGYTDHLAIIGSLSL